MGLSNDLMSQFAKATVDKRVETETTVYGTVVEYNDKYYVKLDGSDRLTPMPATAEALPNDRVSIKIKNHTATITGNVSSPAARVGRVEEIDGKLAVYIPKIEADSAAIKVIESKYVKTEQLDAIEGRFDTLEANDVTINEKLTAKEADIEKLKADFAEFERVDVDYIKAEVLDAVSGRIGDLESDVADIDTLIFGSAAGDVIQPSFANMVVAQIGDAQIKSAMIESISTTEVTVKSSDGRLLISDETIQISDENRVRVQIGKDGNNDYSINIWDADGNLMFSEGGITDSAIKDAIIRNDMVSDNANISASKLDIDSLFTEINNSTKYIKSTKVYLDEENQTLDVSFKQMATDVDGLSEDVSSHGTQLSVIQGQIDSKIWQQDIDAAKGEMSTKYSEMEQTVEGFKTSVRETYATKEDLNNIDISNIEVGGRNLLVDTNTSRSVDHFATSNPDGLSVDISYRESETDIVTDYTGVVNMYASYASDLHVFYTDALRVWLEPDKEYVVSFDIKFAGMDLMDDDGDGMFYPQIGISNIQGQNTQAPYAMASGIDTYIGQYWQHVTCKLRTLTSIPWGTPLTEQSLCIKFGEFVYVEWFDIKNIKLEEGTVPTAWSPAPEDNATKGDIKNVTDKYAEFKQDVDGFKTTVGETYATKEETETGFDNVSSESNDNFSNLNDRVILAESTIQQLKDTISMLIVDENGESLMEQTSTGWTFKIESIQSSLNNVSQNIDTLINDLGSVEAVVDALDDAVEDLGKTAEYVKIMTYESEPCIALGKKDSVFKLLITNTRIMFLDGDNVPTYINTTGLVTENITVNNELIQNGWVWKVRANGNYGLIWRGDG